MNKLALAVLLLFFRVFDVMASPTVSIVGVVSSNISNKDAFDVSKNVLSIGGSNLHPDGYHPSDAFGGVAGTYFPGEVIFSDNGYAGQKDFLTVSSVSPVSIVGIRLLTYDDSYNPGSFNRGLSQFKMFAGKNPEALVEVFSTSLSGNFKQSYGSAGIELVASFDEVVANFFRFEFSRVNSTGPRIVEIDAISAVPEPSALSTFCVGVGVVCLILYRRRRGLMSV